MKEELIRVENGLFQGEGGECRFDISVSRGECIGIYVDEHLTSGTACLNIFKRSAHWKSGKLFLRGERAGAAALEHWIAKHSRIVDRFRFTSKDLTVRDYVLALSKPMWWRDRRRAERRLAAEETEDMLHRMGFSPAWDCKLTALSLLDYYRLAVFCAWFWKNQLLILDRMTEILRAKDLEKLMRFVQLLQQDGVAVLLFDMEEDFLYRYTDRIDVVKNRKTCYRLYPDEYDGRLYEVLGWKSRGGAPARIASQCEGKVVLEVTGLSFPSVPVLDFQIRSGEIAFLPDENYHTASCVQDCFLREQSWQSGRVALNGKVCTHAELIRQIGTQIGIQMARPDRAGGVLFEQLTALDNLSICLFPKAGRYFIRNQVAENILQESTAWFSREAMQRPLYTWSLPERLRFSYYKWYLINPSLLLCFFPFAGQESSHHEMILDMLVTCARRGMAIWVISSGIDFICNKTENQEFLARLRYLRV